MIIILQNVFGTRFQSEGGGQGIVGVIYSNVFLSLFLVNRLRMNEMEILSVKTGSKLKIRDYGSNFSGQSLTMSNESIDS